MQSKEFNTISRGFLKKKKKSQKKKLYFKSYWQFISFQLFHLPISHCMLKVLVAQSCLTLCDLMDYSWPGSSVHRILQARILEWVAIPFSRRFSWPRDWTQVSCTASRLLTIWATREAHCMLVNINFSQLQKLYLQHVKDKSFEGQKQNWKGFFFFHLFLLVGG